jgi:hypothetical protein
MRIQSETTSKLSQLKIYRTLRYEDVNAPFMRCFPSFYHRIYLHKHQRLRVPLGIFRSYISHILSKVIAEREPNGPHTRFERDVDLLDSADDVTRR